MKGWGAFLICIGLLAASAATAEVRATSMSRTKLFANQSAILDGRASQQYSNSVRLQPKTPGASTTVPRFSGRYRGEWLTHARDAARRHGIPEDLFLRLVQQESGWNASAISPKGAIGLAQLMPATARVLGVDPRDPRQNLEGGARYLAAQFKKYRDWRLALAAYNAGPHAVDKYNGIPPYRETQGYVAAILGN